MVLAGVGGNTIAKAKATLSYAEAMRWYAYIRKRGSLNVGRRVENGFALLATMYNRSKGGKAEFHDFAPHEREEHVSDDFAAVVKILSGGGG